MHELKVCMETEDFWLDGKRLILAQRPTAILVKLASRMGGTVSMDSLCKCWGFDDSVFDDRHCVMNVVCRLKKILGKDSIITRPGIGYFLNMKVVPIKLEDIEGLISS